MEREGRGPAGSGVERPVQPHRARPAASPPALPRPARAQAWAVCALTWTRVRREPRGWRWWWDGARREEGKGSAAAAAPPLSTAAAAKGEQRLLFLPSSRPASAQTVPTPPAGLERGP